MSELNRSGPDILLVEDDPPLRKCEAALLDRLGAEVSAVETLEGARRLMSQLKTCSSVDSEQWALSAGQLSKDLGRGWKSLVGLSCP